jgi:DNA-binding beta-propeller fold protein YncE
MSEDDNGGRAAGARVPRRLLLKTFATGSLLFEPACGQAALEADPEVRAHGVAHAIESPITIENRLPGSDAYQLTKPALGGEVEGYASSTSVTAGDALQVFVNVSRAQGVRCDVYRIGHYQGLGARLVSVAVSVPVAPQPAPAILPTTGLIECQWQSAFDLLVDASWLTGYYLCKLTNDDGFESYVPFIVRESERLAPLLVQASVTTWQAYNTWGGLSLYFNQLPNTGVFSGPRGYQVSFDRPYAPSADIGSVEHGLVRFVERMGYDVGYVCNVDIDREPELLQGRLLFATVGHDEYWSLTERNAVQNARDAGLSLAFFSGNTGYRRIRLESSSSGTDRRIITCYKSGALDPIQHAPDTTTNFSSPPDARPENELLGVLWSGGWSHLEGYPFLVSAPDHWIYEGTGVQANEVLAHVIGNEWDVTSDNGLAPAGLEVVGDSPALGEYGYLSRATATVYYPTATSFVFAAATIGWANGLGTPGLMDARLQRVTENILLRAGLFPEARVVLPPRASPEIGTSERAVVVAGTAVAGNADGPALSAQFKYPSGIAVGPSGELYVCDTGNNLVRKLSADAQVSTLVGNARTLHLNTPTGIAVGPDGKVYVSDTGNHRILEIAADGSSRVLAGSAQGNLDRQNPRKARFNYPRGLAVDAAGALYVADFRNDAIRRIDASGVTTVVSQAGGPTAVAVAADGSLYYVATWNGSVVRVSPDGTRSVLANPSQVFGDQSGPGATAALRPADALCLTPLGLVFTDTGNNRVRALLFDAENPVWTLLGDGQGGAGVGSGPETRLGLPRGLAPSNGGYLVADSANHRILWFSV